MKCQEFKLKYIDYEIQIISSVSKIGFLQFDSSSAIITLEHALNAIVIRTELHLLLVQVSHDYPVCLKQDRLRYLLIFYSKKLNAYLMITVVHCLNRVTFSQVSSK